MKNKIELPMDKLHNSNVSSKENNQRGTLLDQFRITLILHRKITFLITFIICFHAAAESNIDVVWKDDDTIWYEATCHDPLNSKSNILEATKIFTNTTHAKYL